MKTIAGKRYAATRIATGFTNLHTLPIRLPQAGKRPSIKRTPPTAPSDNFQGRSPSIIDEPIGKIRDF